MSLKPMMSKTHRPLVASHKCNFALMFNEHFLVIGLNPTCTNTIKDYLVQHFEW